MFLLLGKFGLAAVVVSVGKGLRESGAAAQLSNLIDGNEVLPCYGNKRMVSCQHVRSPLTHTDQRSTPKSDNLNDIVRGLSHLRASSG